MRHYYDVYCLLQHPDVQAFVGSDQYYAHKKKRFRSADNPLIAENNAFLLSDPKVIEEYIGTHIGKRETSITWINHRLRTFYC